ncbi:MAG TPA: hypothetical protein VML55_12850 [Planctomycetaceae bacterium]|nr:hypothetical protein [Planctomycetaceae bacterium]
MPRNAPFSPYRRAGAWFIVLAVATYLTSLLLPAVESEQGWVSSGSELLLGAFQGIFEATKPRERAWCAAATGANLLFAGAFFGGMVWFGRRACQAAAAVCLFAALTARLIPVLYHPQRWAVPGLLVGYWLWIASMLLAAIGFWMLAMWFRQGPMPEQDS